eukprot:NODE_2729_length_650_cov_11.039933_g2256_i0.p1 GENE.NODE_2729_length_650_cov_11.039933_g2256_i0~~NODE_2729_length_650_cov_11.039933_g2256_i0.p1  ORF type:complete len:107 (-),score=10.73 NODE_2729_length_650_cov_11.039933_g2256_i0:141-461(-)
MLVLPKANAQMVGGGCFPGGLFCAGRVWPASQTASCMPPPHPSPSATTALWWCVLYIYLFWAPRRIVLYDGEATTPVLCEVERFGYILFTYSLRTHRAPRAAQQSQ